MGQMVKTRTRGKSSDETVADRAKSFFGDNFTARRAKSATAIADAAEALRLTSHSLGENVFVPYVEKAADQLTRVADFVREANPKEIARSVEDFARREPLLFLGGAVAVGLLGGRFMKASASSIQKNDEALND